jgi:hypothetical protein
MAEPSCPSYLLSRNRTSCPLCPTSIAQGGTGIRATRRATRSYPVYPGRHTTYCTWHGARDSCKSHSAAQAPGSLSLKYTAVNVWLVQDSTGFLFNAKITHAWQCAGVTLWFVGLPRRKSSLSMEGRSSWMSDMVCSISIAHAVGMACAMFPPTASHAARQRHGRTRLPPASSEYLRATAPRVKGFDRPCLQP